MTADELRSGPSEEAPGRTRERESRRRAAASGIVRDSLRALPGLTLVNPPGGIEYLVYANRSEAIWLLPADWRSRQPALALNSPHTIRGRVLRLAMRAGRLSRGRISLDGDAVRELRRDLEVQCGLSPGPLAFYIGPPNVSRKCTVCAADSSGRVVAFAKAAVLEPARDMVKSEQQVLSSLADSSSLTGRVPRIIGQFAWRGADVLVLLPGPTGHAPRRFGRLHVDFLAGLHESSAADGVLLESPAWSAAMQTVERLGPRLPDVWTERIGRASQRLASRFGRSRIPLVRAHRDFAPWNMRLGDAGLFVFDWELSRMGLTPLHDALQYSVLPAVLMQRSYSVPDLAHELLRLCPDEAPDIQDLLLASLVDMGIDYAASAVEHPARGKARVRDWFGREIDRVLAVS